MNESMDETLIKILVEKWALPEHHVRKFMAELLNGKPADLDNIRNSSVDMIHGMILKEESSGN